MENNRLKYLLSRQKHGRLNADEEAELNHWYSKLCVEPGELDITEIDKNEFYSEFRRRIEPRRLRPLYKIYAAAAILISIIGTGIWLNFSGRAADPAAVVNVSKPIEPGGDRAYLTLEDGSRIALNDIADGEILKAAGIQVSKAKNGQLVYQALDEPVVSGNVGYHLIETPRGGQYQILLPDGSHVWLNAASSLKYPTRFTGDERRVELKGEAYFEIAHDRSMPFRVSSEDQVVEVLGTHFNVKAYSEEDVTLTTLVEGSVKIVAGSGHSKVIVPGQQSRVGRDGLKISDVNTAFAVAWKEGKFLFGNDNLEGVMRQIARWYDVEIEYQNGVPQKRVWGSVSRFDNVEDVLKLLELSKLARFEIKGRRIIVMK